MNDKQNAELNMFQAVETIFATNASKYAAIPIFKTAVDNFKGKVLAIQELDKSRSETKVPVATEKKNIAEDKLIQLTLKIARVMNVYAFNVKNTQIFDQTNISKSTFYNLPDNGKITLSKSISETANLHNKTLQSYGIAQTDLKELTDAITFYEQQIVTPRDVTTERKEMTRALAQLFAEAKSLLIDQLDKLMSIFKESEPEFYNTYFNARNVINTAYRKKTKTQTPE